MFRYLSFAILVLCPAAARAESLQIDGLPVPVEISLPENHDPAKKWPAVFFYHGIGGRPATAMIRDHTGPRDWIVVGMTYSFEGQFRYTPESLKKELAILHDTRDRLVAAHGADPARVHVAGFSQGGWMSGMFFQIDRSLAGAAILGAGHLNDISPKSAPRDGTPLFIGAGRLDGVYPFALKARLFHAGRGAGVTMETWAGLKHEFPKEGSPGLKEWFALRNGGEPDAAALEEEFERITALPPLPQWQALLDFRERPYVNAPGQPWPERLREKIAELERRPEVAGEAAVFKRHRQLLAAELNMKTLEDLAKIGQGYESLVQAAGNGARAELVAMDRQRIAVLMESYESQRPQAAPEATPTTPNFPKSDRGIPRNPLVR